MKPGDLDFFGSLATDVSVTTIICTTDPLRTRIDGAFKSYTHARLYSRREDNGERNRLKRAIKVLPPSGPHLSQQ
jgi:hypothetical protein